MIKKKKYLSLILCIALITIQFSPMAYADDELNSVNQSAKINYSESNGTVDVSGENTGTVEDDAQVSSVNTETVEDDTQVSDENTETVESDTEVSDENTETVEGDTQVSDENTGTVEGDTQVSDENTETVEGDTEVSDENTGTVEGDTQVSNTTDAGIEEKKDNTEATEEKGLLETIKEVFIMPLLVVNEGPIAISDYDVNKEYAKGITYTISTIEELKTFSDLVNGNVKKSSGESVNINFEEDTVLLKGNITLKGAWTPIGTVSTPFSGTFDGDKHTINDLELNNNDDYQGIFGYTLNGEVKDLTVSGSIKSTGNYIGGIIAYANCTDITGCINNVEITGGESFIGGIAGCATGYTTKCKNNKDLSASKNFIGGIVGLNHGLIKDCFNKGKIVGDNYVGGITGKGKVKNSLSLEIAASSGSGDHVNDISADGVMTNCYSNSAPEAQMKYGYIVYQLNTNAETTESSDIWKQGESSPEFGKNPVFRVSLKNIASDNTTITFLKNGEVISNDAIFSKDGTDNIYVTNGDLTLKVKENQPKEGFHFNLAIFTKAGADTYTVHVKEDINAEAGYGELPSELAENQIAWYIKDTNADKYVIENAKQLYGLSMLVNGTAKDSSGDTIEAVNFDKKTITLKNDIDLNGEEWLPIGHPYWNPFKGILDGENHTIKGLKITSAGDDKGLFGYTDSAEIKNLTVEGSINNPDNDETGGIAGYASDSRIINCVNKVQIIGGDYTGGIVGTTGWGSGASIISCKNIAQVSGKKNTGGIAGKCANIENCLNLGAVSSTADKVGGIVGDGEAKNCYNNSQVTTTGTGKNIGAFAGSGTVINCYSSVAVTDKEGNSKTDATGKNLLKGGYIVYQLNTSGETEENSGIWKQGAEGPEFGKNNIFKVSVINYSSGKVGISFLKDGTSIPKELVVSKNGIDNIYVTKGEIKINTNPSNSKLEFKPSISGEGGIYTVTVEGDLTFQCGLAEDLKKATGEEARISWYTKEKTASCYTINTAYELWGLMSLVNGNIQGYSALDFSGKTINLGDNIDLKLLSESSDKSYEWTPIGTEKKLIGIDKPFKGIFNGNNYTVSGLHIDSNKDNQGLFGYTLEGEIQNLKVQGDVNGSNNVGGIVGLAEKTKITNCVLTGISEIQGKSKVGGIAGNTSSYKSRVSKCICDQNAKINAIDDYAGGIVGDSSATITDSYCLGTVLCGGEHKGGIAGKSAKTVKGCFCYNKEQQISVAGKDTQVSNCYYLADKELKAGLGTYKTAEDFAGREFAWLLDIASGSHSSTWQPGASYPVFGENTVYKISIAPKEIEEGKSVKFADPGQEDNYKIYTDENGKYYSYVLNSETVNLSVTSDDATKIIFFYPKDAITKTEEIYSINNPKSDLDIEYKFGGYVSEDIEWFTQNKNAKEFIVSTEAQLRGLALLVNGLAHDTEKNQILPFDFSDKIIKLNSDINIVGQDWIAIGTKQTPFNGTFDGNGHSVNNYKIDSSDDYKGLFGYAGTATIENLNVKGEVSGSAYVGGIIGYMGEKSTISNCNNAGSVIGSQNYVGGIVGYKAVNGNLKDCSNSGEICGGNGNYAFVGGIAGVIYDHVIVDNCTNSGTITGNGKYTGGINGNSCANMVIRNCSNSGEISGNNDYVGGIVGGIDNGLLEMKNCFNTGEIIETGNGSYKVGGITGDLGTPADSKTTVTYCYNEGTITNLSSDKSTSNNGTGGIFGCISSDYGDNIHHCWNKGNVTSTAANTGGIAGYINQDSCVVDCYNLANINGAENTAGIVGSKANTSNSNVESCFNYGGYITGVGTNIGAIAGANNSNILGCFYSDKITIKNKEGDVTASDTNALKISENKFKNFDTIYKLNTKGDTVKNRGIWAIGEVYPVFASGEQKLLHKVELSLSDKTKGMVTFTGESSNLKYLSGGEKISFNIKPNDGYILDKYTVKSILGENIETDFIETKSGELTVSFTMPEVGVIVNTEFIKPDIEKVGTFKITFDANGGKWNDKETKVVEVGAYKRVEKPENPVWGVREFKGWFTDKECKNQYNFSSAVQSDLNLYAKWDICYKVDLNPNGGKWEDESKSFIKVLPNKAVACPEAKPVRAGYEFVGWFTDKEECFNPYNFNNIVTGDMEIYACWTKEGTFQVIYDANGGKLSLKEKSSESVERFKVSVPKGTILQSPFDLGYIISKKSEGKDMMLRGWYNNQKTGTRWNFNNSVEANMTLYAHWDGDKPVIIGGTKENPMEIEDLDLLVAMRDNVNAGEPYNEYYFKLVNDITLPKDWEPIGVQGSKYAAYFDGDGHTITIAPGGRPLFGIVQKCEIKNVNIFGKQIQGSGIIEFYENEVLIDNCTIKSGSRLKGSGFIGQGPQAGKDVVTIKNCKVEEGVIVGYTKDQENIGGVAGSVNCIIENCVSNADVYGTNCVGGIVGSRVMAMTHFEISNCYTGGSVNATGHSAGGIAGSGYYYLAGDIAAVNSSIRNCYSTASVSGDNYVGGIIGSEVTRPNNRNGYEVQNNYWYGKSITANGEYVGGIIGYVRNLTDFLLCNNYYASSDDSLKGIGGISKITNSKINLEEVFKLKPEEAFANGEVAYLLDGGIKEHSNVWTMGDKYPVFGKPSIYMAEGKTEGSGTLVLSDSEHEGKNIYAPIGTTVTVTATPAKYENSSSDGKTYENTLESIIVTSGNGETKDIKDSKTFVSTGNDVVTATFKLTEKTIEPEPKPETKPDYNPSHGGHGHGSGNGNGKGEGNGSGSSIGDGSGNGAGTQGTEKGKGEGTGSASGNTTGGTSSSSNSQASNTEDVFAQVSQEETALSNVVIAEDAEKANEDIENSGGLEKGGSEEGNIDNVKKVEDEKDEETEGIKVFEVIKKIVKENPYIMILTGLCILAVVMMGAGNRYFRNKKTKLK